LRRRGLVSRELIKRSSEDDHSDLPNLLLHEFRFDFSEEGFEEGIESRFSQLDLIAPIWKATSKLVTYQAIMRFWYESAELVTLVIERLRGPSFHVRLQHCQNPGPALKLVSVGFTGSFRRIA
jgi:hypothetical protein